MLKYCADHSDLAPWEKLLVMSAAPDLPVLLPRRALARTELLPREWAPQMDLLKPNPPPPDDARTHDQEMAMARQLMDGKTVKKVRPRRTVDYGGPLGRWALVSFSCTPTHVLLNDLCHSYGSRGLTQHTYRI